MNTTALDSYESICDYARSLSEDLDERRWLLGDCAALIQTKYGEHNIDSFAKEIGQRKSTIRQYAAISRYYPDVIRGIIIESMPNIFFSHMRDAMRISHDVQDALKWLGEVSEQGYSVDEASRHLTEKLGHETRESVQGKVISFTRDFNGRVEVKLEVFGDEMKWLAKLGEVVIRPK